MNNSFKFNYNQSLRKISPLVPNNTLPLRCYSFLVLRELSNLHIMKLSLFCRRDKYESISRKSK